MDDLPTSQYVYKFWRPVLYGNDGGGRSPNRKAAELVQPPNQAEPEPEEPQVPDAEATEQVQPENEAEEKVPREQVGDEDEEESPEDLNMEAGEQDQEDNEESETSETITDPIIEAQRQAHIDRMKRLQAFMDNENNRIDPENVQANMTSASNDIDSNVQGYFDENNRRRNQELREPANVNRQIIDPARYYNYIPPVLARYNAAFSRWREVLPASNHMAYTCGDGNSALRDGTLPLYDEFKENVPDLFRKMNVFKILAREREPGTFPNIPPGLTYGYVRHFIVIKRKEDHCLCLPIYMFSVEDPAARIDHYGLIYSGIRPPYFRPGDQPTWRTDVRMDAWFPKRDLLTRRTRIDYSELFVVRYSVKSSFIGKIARNHQHTVFTNYYTSRAYLEYEAAVEYADQNYYQESKPGEQPYVRRLL